MKKARFTLVADRDLELDVMREISRENGKRAGSATTGGVRAGARAVVATSVRAAVGCEVHDGIRVASGGQGRARRRRHAGTVGPSTFVLAIGASMCFWSARDTS
jgi:hypothetical protein